MHSCFIIFILSLNSPRQTFSRHLMGHTRDLWFQNGSRKVTFCSQKSVAQYFIGQRFLCFRLLPADDDNHYDMMIRERLVVSSLTWTSMASLGYWTFSIGWGKGAIEGRKLSISTSNGKRRKHSVVVWSSIPCRDGWIRTAAWRNKAWVIAI